MKKAIAEALGTFGLVFIGTGSIVLDQVYDGVFGVYGIAGFFAVAVFAMILCTAPFSNAFLNPAVTLAFKARGIISWKETSVTCIAQLGGAVAASYALSALFAGNMDLGTTHPKAGMMTSFILEFAMTFLLLLVIFRVGEWKQKLGVKAAIIAVVVGLEAAFGGPFTGASMNPARSFGPALASDQLEHVWLYIVAPIAGAMAAHFFVHLSSRQKSLHE